MTEPRATINIIAIFPHGSGDRCRGCSGRDAGALLFVMCLGRGYLFDICDLCTIALGSRTKAALGRAGTWAS